MVQQQCTRSRDDRGLIQPGRAAIGAASSAWRRAEFNSECLADQPQGIGAVPLPRTIDFVEHAAIGADQYSERQPRCTEQVFHLQLGIDKLADGRIGLLEEAQGLIGIVIRRNADHRKPAGGLQPCQPLQRLHFRFARPAPARPDIDDQRPAAEFRQPFRRTVQSLQGRVAQHVSDLRFRRRIPECCVRAAQATQQQHRK
jgi:hypothetical protein